MVYCFLTALQCVTKHFASYGMLMVGRLLGGMASCLLFTAFESWMVSETTRRGFSERALKYTFGCKELLSSAVAVAAGLVAQLAACGLSDKPLPLVAPFGEGSSFRLGGYCTSFDVVIFFCGVCALLTQFWWTENYGSSEGVWIGFGRAVAVLREPRVLLIGLVVALFESAMFLWVFIWTPSLSKAGVHDPPYALLFACFMAAKMAGSQVFTGLSAVFSTTSILLGAMILASSSHVAAVVLIRMLALFDAGDARTSACLWAMLAAFILFEVAVGIYWPAAGVLKAQVVPESCRATLYSIFRLPLNAIVFLCLLFINRAEATLMATSVLLLAATMFAVGLTITLQAPSGLSKALLAKQDSRQYA
jgi:hypothetical protein